MLEFWNPIYIINTFLSILIAKTEIISSLLWKECSFLLFLVDNKPSHLSLPLYLHYVSHRLKRGQEFSFLSTLYIRQSLWCDMLFLLFFLFFFWKDKIIFCSTKTTCSILVLIPFFLAKPTSPLRLCKFTHLAARFPQWPGELVLAYLKFFFSTWPPLTLHYSKTVI